MEEDIVEVREELMLSPNGNSEPTLRMAHFLKPSKVSTFENPLVPNPSPVPQTFNPKKWPLKIKFCTWRYPTLEWKSWVEHLEPKFHSIWKQAGIYEAIMSSTVKISRDEGLIIGLAEKWCPETNSFVFSWGEASVTLEDVIILGGFSVLGSPAFGGSVKSNGDEGIFRKLRNVWSEMAQVRRRYCSQSKWMKKFMFSGSEIEHAAFLCLWMQRFVFHDSAMVLRYRVLPIATRLAKGERLALAPFILAGIYKDLSLLKASIVSMTQLDNDGGGDSLVIDLQSHIWLVQLWAWERFPEFQPKRKSMKNGDPRPALWDQARGAKVENVRLALDSAGETFRWRPYAVGQNGWRFPKFYKEKGDLYNLQSDEDVLSFSLCLRESRLVGLGCMQHYLPHRVAMQFGFDQDLPFNTAWTNETSEDAWMSYMRPFTGTELYVPSRLFESDVTDRYLKWWKWSVLGPRDVLKDAMLTVTRGKRHSRKRLRRAPSDSNDIDRDKDADFALPTRSECNLAAEMKLLNEQTAVDNRASSKLVLITEMHFPIKPKEDFAPANVGVVESPTSLKQTNPLDDGNAFCTEENAFSIAQKKKGDAFEEPAVDFEARIARLQRELNKLKASRFGKIVVID